MNTTKIDVVQMREMFRKGDTIRDAGLIEPENLVKHRDLTYGPYGEENTFDIYYPKGTSQPLPTIVHIHGGGFFYGDKELYRFYTMFLAQQGFTVINYNYRLAPKNKYPAPLEDTNTLMQWLIENGETYFVDTKQLFVLGDSAGGQLVEQYTTMVTNPTYADLFSFPITPVSFKAVALNCGAYFIGENGMDETEFPFYLGDPVPEEIKKQFPVESFLTAHFPPTFVMTSSHDFLRDRAQPLVNRLGEQNVPVTYRVFAYEDGSELGHVFHIDQKSEIAKECNLAEIAFFRQFIDA